MWPYFTVPLEGYIRQARLYVSPCVCTDFIDKIFHTVSTNYFSTNTHECNKLTGLVYVYVITKWTRRNKTLSEQFQNLMACYRHFYYIIGVKQHFILAIALSVLLRYTDSDYPFGIFKLFLWAKISRLSEMMRSYQCFTMWIKSQPSNIAGQTPLYVIFSLVDKPEIYVGTIYNSPYSNEMNIRWKYDGGSGYILILKYESFVTEPSYDFVAVSVWHYFYH